MKYHSIDIEADWLNPDKRSWDELSPGCKVLRHGEDSSKDLFDIQGFDRHYTRAQLLTLLSRDARVFFSNYTAEYRPEEAEGKKEGRDEHESA